MIRKLLVIGLFPLLTFTLSCKKGTKDAKKEEENIPHLHEVFDSSSFKGDYSGILPCASCPGIETTITLNEDETYVKIATYEESDLPTESSKGKIEWLDNKSKLKIDGTLFKLKNGNLIMLDPAGKEVTGSLADKYILKKK